MEYNRLIIVGNGFDLSQGLKSSYSHFLFDYLKSTYLSVYQNGFFEYDFILIKIDYEIGDAGWLRKVLL